MALWGAYESDESKPKYLTDAEKKNTYATDAGWVYKDPNTGLEEVLVAIGGLAGGTSATTNLGEATINSIEWVTTALDDGDTAISVKVVYNEKVDVVTTGGTPTVTITNDDTSGDGNGDYDLEYASGTGTNQLTFTGTSLTLSATDELSIGAQNIALNSGTMKDAGTSVNSGVAISAAQGTAAGTITVTAA
jgi:hypothetical protein